VLDAVVSGNEEGGRHAEEQAVRNDSRVASNPRQCEGELMMAEAQRANVRATTLFPLLH
jgi:hypothetical protein